MQILPSLSLVSSFTTTCHWFSAPSEHEESATPLIINSLMAAAHMGISQLGLPKTNPTLPDKKFKFSKRIREFVDYCVASGSLTFKISEAFWAIYFHTYESKLELFDQVEHMDTIEQFVLAIQRFRTWPSEEAFIQCLMGDLKLEYDTSFVLRKIYHYYLKTIKPQAFTEQQFQREFDAKAVYRNVFKRSLLATGSQLLLCMKSQLLL